MTLGLSLKPAGPSFHLKNGGDDTCILAGIVMRIREIRKINRALLIPSKSAAITGCDLRCNEKAARAEMPLPAARKAALKSRCWKDMQRAGFTYECDL